ncbi:Uncharacterized protein, UPF0548 family [Quadrisphaera granulorum]|uniref:Uncharacterized protein (UPF0548 family) n=1 Tax=Quadrisphaera granulorum TaxID=317664 RepID=A0A316A6K2_9ACTN|nr:DUF1990 domain-containing protein [Quadrisphaera granulorum]PWJ53112.1 uncharacterized protein (UPF0548 family) [Quadrisphaera granulorum]SZE97044.1 Uncharacterized protein, UPF0548 family [Quadrisphaera granulorum]
MARDLTYEHVGATHPADPDWPPVAAPAGFRRHESTTLIGQDDDGDDAVWRSAADAALSWGVKTRSGFTVHPSPGPGGVTLGEELWVHAAFGPLTVREPVRVVAVVDTPDRCGFAYGTLRGHPVSGEEAFVVHRDPDGRVWLTLRSLTRPAPGGLWRAAFPVLLVAQLLYRRRYQRALVTSR